VSSPAPEARRMQELIEHQERVLDLVQIGSWEWDLIQDRTYWSQGLYRIFGVDSATYEATLQGYLERVHPEDREWVAALVTEAVESKARMEFEFRIVHTDGTVRLLEATSDPVVDQDGR
jgi:PAS domain S-box-containing protein